MFQSTKFHAGCTHSHVWGPPGARVVSIFVKRVFCTCRKFFFREFWISQSFCQLIFGFARFLSAYFGSGRVFCKLILNPAGLLVAYFGSSRGFWQLMLRLVRVFGSLFCVQPGFLVAYFGSSHGFFHLRIRIPDQVRLKRTSGLAGFRIIFSMEPHLIMPDRLLQGNTQVKRGLDAPLPTHPQISIPHYNSCIIIYFEGY